MGGLQTLANLVSWSLTGHKTQLVLSSAVLSPYCHTIILTIQWLALWQYNKTYRVISQDIYTEPAKHLALDISHLMVCSLLTGMCVLT